MYFMKANVKIVLLSSIITISGILIYHYFFNDKQTLIFADDFQGKNISFNATTQKDKIALNSFSELAKKYIPTVVYIRSVKDNQNSTGEYESGSGVVISPSGHIITNSHVVDDAAVILVTDENNITYKAEKIGMDKDSDIALLKIDVKNHPFIFLGDSEHVQTGDWILQIGNPFKLRNSVSAGIVSAKYRILNLRGASGIEAYIQTDAVANPGNSGGAMIDMNGKLVGMISAIATGSGVFEGYSFGIPANIVKKVVKDLLQYGTVQRARVGIQIKDAEGGGIVVERVDAGTDAQKRGLKPGDKILGLNDSDIYNAAHFQSLVFQYRPGDTIILHIDSDGKTEDIEIVLKNHLNTTGYITNRRDKVFNQWGLVLRDLTKKEKEEFSTDGVYVVSVKKGSKASEISIEPGYIIDGINSVTIKNVDDLVEKLQATKGSIILHGFYKAYPGVYKYVLKP